MTFESNLYLPAAAAVFTADEIGLKVDIFLGLQERGELDLYDLAAMRWLNGQTDIPAVHAPAIEDALGKVGVSPDLLAGLAEAAEPRRPAREKFVALPAPWARDRAAA